MSVENNKNQKSHIYNPAEMSIRMHKKTGPGGNVYYIGNCDMDLHILDTVIRFEPDEKNTDRGTLKINNVKDKARSNQDSDDSETE